MRDRQRLGKLLLRRELVYPGPALGAVACGGAACRIAGGVAYAPVSEALRPLTRELRGTDALRRRRRRRRRRRTVRRILRSDLLFVRALELLERLAGEQPVVLVIAGLDMAVVASCVRRHLADGPCRRGVLVERLGPEGFRRIARSGAGL